MTRADRMTEILQRELAPTALEIQDDSSRHLGHAGARPEGETHYTLHISSPKLSTLSRVEQHRLIYTILAPELNSGLHALAIKVS